MSARRPLLEKIAIKRHECAGCGQAIRVGDRFFQKSALAHAHPMDRPRLCVECRGAR